ncbi:hypothetical protein RV10_GL000899 [Enterococcus pallens]|nr:hypothetical protein RV10_GL000899 [Enterococcus pallens]
MKVTGNHWALKGKKTVKAIYITEFNVSEVEELTQAFTRFDVSGTTLLTGFMSFQNFPVWMININPRSKQKKFIFEHSIQNYLEVVV